MYAIRCRETGRSFRRDGVVFEGSAWTIVEEPTEAQLAEPMLVCVEIEDEDDPRLLEIPVSAPAAEEAVTSDESEANDLKAAETYIGKLESANAECQTEIERLTAENEALKVENATLGTEVSSHHTAASDIAAENALLKIEIEGLKAGQSVPVDAGEQVDALDAAESAPAKAGDTDENPAKAGKAAKAGN